MKVSQLDKILTHAITSANHPEIESVTELAVADNEALKHTRIAVTFANGAHAHIMVRDVSGPNVPRHAKYEIPREVG
jgi:aminoglycoside phosphotransferase family enzyme